MGTLQIITGDARVNKKEPMIQKALEIKKENPQATIYYIVPDHMKFEMETYVLNQLQQLQGQTQSAMLDIQVVSFTRLAWFMMPPSLHSFLNLSQTGITMLVRQLLLDLKEELIVFQGQINYQGFIQELVTLLNELYDGRVLPEDLTPQFVEEKKGMADEPILSMDERKLTELQLIYQHFLTAMETMNLSQYQLTEQFKDYLKRQGSLADHYLFVDHMYAFNAEDMELLLCLIKHFESTWVTLPLTHQEAASLDWQARVDVQKETYQRLKMLAHEQQIKVLPDWNIATPLWEYSHDILALADYFKASYQGNHALTPIEFNDPFELWTCDLPQTEVKEVSQRIRQLVMLKGYRYQDILVVMRNLDDYQHIVGPYFAENDIPYFYDHQRLMINHPLMTWLEGVLNLKRFHWRHEDIMTVLKSSVFCPEYSYHQFDRDYILNRLENCMLANGYEGFRFYSCDYEWNFLEGDLLFDEYQSPTITTYEVLQDYRLKVSNILLKYLNQWDKPMAGQQASRWLYELLLSTNVQARLIGLRDLAIEEGRVQESLQHEQVWDLLMNLLDEFHLLYEERLMDFETFVSILMSGIEEGKYLTIPPTMDQVTITNIESPRAKPYKVCFVLGANSHELPLVSDHTSILTPQNREMIKEQLTSEQYLPDIDQQNANFEVFNFYQLLLAATDKLYLSYSVNSNDTPQTLSPYIELLMNGFNWKTYVYSSGSYERRQWLGKYTTYLPYLMQRIRESYETSRPLSQSTYELVRHLKQLPKAQKQPTIRALVEQSFFASPLPTTIDPQTARQLYGENLFLSVSRIERFYQDPFSHFLLYGLRLQPREMFEVNRMKTGDYFHDFMDHIFQRLLQQSTDITQLTKHQMDQLIAQMVDHFQQDTKYQLFYSHPRMTAIRKQMDQRLKDFLYFTLDQFKRMKGQPLLTEALFGVGPGTLNTLEFPLSTGGKLSLTGKIDRIDQLQVDNQSFLQVVDYKSGHKKFDLQDVYYGLDLQILTYLSVVMENYPESHPLGGFYQPMLQGFMEATLEDDPLQKTKDTSRRLQTNQYQGFVTVDANTIKQVEDFGEGSGRSFIYPVSYTKSGVRKDNLAFTLDQWKLLKEYVFYLFQQAGERIQSGDIELVPFIDEISYTTSLQTDYRTISGFDATQNAHQYKYKTVSNKLDPVFTAMTEKLNKKEENDDESNTD